MKQKRNTPQKRIVFDVFREMHNHPSAGMVYEAVHERYPNISKATVYRLLAEAAEEGNVARLKLNDVDDRYDVTVCKHYHVVCKECGAVSDVSVSFNEGELLQSTVGLEDFTVENVHVEFVGVCDKCSRSSENQNQN